MNLFINNNMRALKINTIIDYGSLITDKPQMTQANVRLHNFRLQYLIIPPQHVSAPMNKDFFLDCYSPVDSPKCRTCTKPCLSLIRQDEQAWDRFYRLQLRVREDFLFCQYLA